MSQQELEQGDLEVMGMVNGHSHPDAAATAEGIAESVWKPVQYADDRTCDCETSAETQYEEACREVRRMQRKRERMERLQVALFVVACVLIAAALVAAWYVPILLIWVVNVGVLACGIAGAVKIDKYIRWWR